jgi:hypothetical protein
MLEVQVLGLQIMDLAAVEVREVWAVTALFQSPEMEAQVYQVASRVPQYIMLAVEVEARGIV